MSYYVSGHSLGGRIRNFRAQRTLEPVPRFFAIVAVAGVGVGWLVSWMSGRQQARWQVPLAALAASWLFMESSALWGRPPTSDDA
jgi:predicted alpha/beta hydrolase